MTGWVAVSKRGTHAPIMKQGTDSHAEDTKDEKVSGLASNTHVEQHHAPTDSGNQCEWIKDPHEIHLNQQFGRVGSWEGHHDTSDSRLLG